MAKINTTAQRTIFVGDNPSADVVGANKAGMFSVLVDRWEAYNQLEGLEVPDLKITNFEELKEYISKRTTS